MDQCLPGQHAATEEKPEETLPRDSGPWPVCRPVALTGLSPESAQRVLPLGTGSVSEVGTVDLRAPHLLGALASPAWAPVMRKGDLPEPGLPQAQPTHPDPDSRPLHYPSNPLSQEQGDSLSCAIWGHPVSLRNGQSVGETIICMP